MSSSISQSIYKRDGRLERFNVSRISNAIYSAMCDTDEGSLGEAKIIAESIFSILQNVDSCLKFIPDVEWVQNIVENKLILNNYLKTSKIYIKYREKYIKFRKYFYIFPEKLKKLSKDSNKYFKNTLCEFVYLRTYARWVENEERRETWIETVNRYINFMKLKLREKITEHEYEELRTAILNQEIMPSMRLLQFSGKAANNTNVCTYNCAFIAPEELKDFGEIMYVLMCGTGIGFSVESKNVHALPNIQYQTGDLCTMHVIDDSKEGWCQALVTGIETWYLGKDLQFDYTKLRPIGARLKTMGGKSSGPDPLMALLLYTRQVILNRQGRRLTSLDIYDIICKIGEVVVSGGVRRSAMISLSDLDDFEMRDAKIGQFYNLEPQRCVTNNSAVYNKKPDNKTLLNEWLALISSGSGERGIFNRACLAKTLPDRRLDFLKVKGYIFSNKIAGIIGTNPCAEIILRSKQFCNLSEVIAKPYDSKKRLLRKIRLAIIIGTYQSTLTQFPYLSKEWKQNCEEERLLGVSITGQWDCPTSREAETLSLLRETSIEVNRIYAKRFGVNPSTCITCVKPSGTVSQTVDCASGIHPRHAPYYIRRIRISATDVLFKMLKEQGVPCYPEVGQTIEHATTFVLEFPIAAPKCSVFKDNLTALDQLEHWKIVKENYTEHSPSITISVGNDEWIDVLQWIDQNWDIIGGLSFLPRTNHIYQLAPYEEISKEFYEKILEKNRYIDFSQLVGFEKEDETDIKKEFACVGEMCDVV